jgi:hypothetical protein
VGCQNGKGMPRPLLPSRARWNSATGPRTTTDPKPAEPNVLAYALSDLRADCSNYWRARARGSDAMETAIGAGTDIALSTLARGGVTGDKLACARSPSAAPAPATRAALVGREG